MAKKSKDVVEGVEAEKGVAEKTVAMIWLHKKRNPGATENCFGLEGVANEDGFLVVQCPKNRVKNELTRRPNFLVPLDFHEKKMKAQKEMEEQFSDYE